MEAERENFRSGQGMIKSEERIEVRTETWMDESRLWVRSRKSRNKKEASGN